MNYLMLYLPMNQKSIVIYVQVNFLVDKSTIFVDQIYSLSSCSLKFKKYQNSRLDQTAAVMTNLNSLRAYLKTLINDLETS